MTNVKARSRTEAIEFDIDFASGVISGRDAARVERMLSWNTTGRVLFPWQQSYPAPDPSHNPASMALVLMGDDFFEIEGDLSKYPPPEIEEIPEGAVA